MNYHVEQITLVDQTVIHREPDVRLFEELMEAAIEWSLRCNHRVLVHGANGPYCENRRIAAYG